MALCDVRWITAEQLRSRFVEAIKRERRRPHMDLCAELLEKIGNDLLFLQLVRGKPSRFVAERGNDVAEAVGDGRRFARSLRRIEDLGVNRLMPPPPRPTLVQELQANLTKFLEIYGHQWNRRETKSHAWLACDRAFTGHIVETLEKAGWRSISRFSPEGPVIAVLSMLIGVVTGEEPDRDSLSSTLKSRTARGKTGRKTGPKPLHDTSRKGV